MMTKELSTILTTALVQFIDRERPEGTVCCSSYECEQIEKAFEGGMYDEVEKLIKRKLLDMTEFEQEVSDIVEYCKEHGENVAFDYAKRHANSLLDFAKKELLKDDVLGRKHLEGYIKGRNDALREMSDFMESHFNGEKARTGTQVVTHMDNCNTQKFVSDDELAASSGTSTLKAEG